MSELNRPQTSPLQAAAANLLERSLRLSEYKNLLVIADPAALDVAEIVLTEARRRAIYAVCVYAPRSQQAAYVAGDELPPTLLEAIHSADGVLSCLADKPDYMPFRRAVLDASTTRFTRTVHAPGLTLKTLSAAAVDFDLIQRRCSELALPLVMGRKLEIHSTDHLGNSHRLVATLPGWDGPPVISDGVVAEGRWGNLPPGETFIFPAGGDGAIAINGSLPDMVLQGMESTVLHFEHGHLTHWWPETGAATRHLFATQLDAARAAGDPNWSYLAEIGFGVNPAIETLLGVQLHDEKKAGTVHIALGGNDILGGHVESRIHCDLVVERPTVLVDGQPLLEHGAFCIDMSKWLLDVHELQNGNLGSPLAGWWQHVSAVHRTVARADHHEGRLHRIWMLKSGRRGRLPVGTNRSARLTARVYDILPESGAPLENAELTERAVRAGIPSELVAACVWLLLRYDLVRIKGDEP